MGEAACAQVAQKKGKKVARHPTAHVKRDYRCYLPVLAGFARPASHRTWPEEKLDGLGSGFNPYFNKFALSLWKSLRDR